MSNDVVKLYTGKIRRGDYDEDYDTAFIGDGSYPIALRIIDDMEQYGRLVSVRYFMSDVERTPDEVLEDIVKISMGVLSSEYQGAYSEITGYLWTDENLTIGGHDLMDEIKSYEGKYCWLEITYHTGQHNDAND